MTIAGTIDAFDEAAYKVGLAQVMGNGIEPDDITLTVRDGSIIVLATVATSSQSAASAAVTSLTTTVTSQLNAALGVSVQSIANPQVSIQMVAASPPPPTSPSPADPDAASPPSDASPPPSPARPPTSALDPLLVWFTVIVDFFANNMDEPLLGFGSGAHLATASRHRLRAIVPSRHLACAAH